MEYYRDHKYPNGWTKSRLYDVRLTYRDFGISVGDYELNLEMVRIDEKTGVKNCAWFRDIDGRLVVADLLFEDHNLRLVITEQGFEFFQKPKERRTVKIFISYAREDLDLAKRMFDELTNAGFKPWFDKECLLPGQRWEVGIEQAIRSSNYFIALLSSNSVAKRGFVQKEIRRALNVLEQMPESDIFLIPARLDECHPSHSALEELNWVDMFPDWEKGVEKIIRVIQTG
jgi:TIR domain